MGRKKLTVAQKQADAERKSIADYENYVSSVLGTRRTTREERLHINTPDIEHEDYHICCKKRKELSIYKWYDSVAEESPETKAPLVIVKAPYKPALVVIDLQNFADILISKHQSLLESSSVKEIEELKKSLQRFEGMETVEERRKRIHTVPYVPFGKHAKSSNINAKIKEKHQLS